MLKKLFVQNNLWYKVDITQIKIPRNKIFTIYKNKTPEMWKDHKVPQLKSATLKTYII